MSAEDKPYRPCVGLMLIDERGRVWMGHRSDLPADADDGAWQMPQGGIDAGEEPLPACLREMEEEIGLPAAGVEILAEAPGWFKYDFPPDVPTKRRRGYAGQTQKWFLARLKADTSAIDVTGVEHPEFDRWDWVELADVTGRVVAFKREVYRQVVAAFAPMIGKN
jgi:putative (di)nucleoside polyphosphate hydrolase